MGITGYIIAITVKSIVEILIEIIFICKSCDKKYLKLPAFKDLFEEFFKNLWFVLTFCFALIIEFCLVEVISFYLYKSMNKEVNIGIWSSCYQLITICKFNKVICLAMDVLVSCGQLFYIVLAKMIKIK